MPPVLCVTLLQAVLLAAVADEPVASVPKANAAESNAATATTNEPATSPAKSETAAEKTETYDEAHRVTTETGRPMVVMVGTDWCGPCQTMKKKILPRVREMGLLKKVAFAVVNADRDQDLARKLTGGGPIPQLVMFRKTPQGWMRRKLVGGQSVETVEQFIHEGLTLDSQERPAQDPSPANKETGNSVLEKTTNHPSDPAKADEAA